MSHKKNMDPKEPTAEELAAEQATITQAPKEEEVRAKIIEEYGFDETDDLERIDKLVKKEMEHHSKLSTAIGQKIGWRTKANAPKEDPKPVVPPKQDAPEDVSAVVSKQLEQRDLDDMSYSDELKKEIQRIATTQGVSVKQAARDPYIVFKIGEEEKQTKTEAATIGKTNRSGSKKSFSDTPPDVDMTTTEGRQTWDDWKKWMSSQGN